MQRQPIPPRNLSSTKEPEVIFPGFTRPSIDFAPVRDERRAKLFYYDIDLSTARSIAAGNAEVLNLAGNSFYVDQNTSLNGYATMHFQDATLGDSSAPVYVGPGFIARVPFTQLLVENIAQAGKILRVFYGVDVDFQAGVNASITITGTNGAFVQAQKTVTNASAAHLAANTSRRYLLIQNNDAAGNIYVNLTGVAATAANGIKLAPGASLEIDNFTPTSAITAIGDIASNANVIMVEG